MKSSFVLITTLAMTLVILGTSGCGKPAAPVYYGFVNFGVDSVGQTESVVSAELKYYNPNNYNLQLKQGEVDVYLNEQFAGHSSLDTALIIPRRDTFYLPVKMRVNMSVITSNALSIFLNKEVDIKLQGKARIGRSGFYMNVPILYEGKQQISF